MSEMDVAGVKREYNRLIKRVEAGSKYLDDNNIPVLEREAKVPAFRKIIDRLNATLFDFKECGVSYTEYEILNGFEVKT